MRVLVIVKATKEAEEQGTPLGWEGATGMFAAPSDLEIRPLWEPEEFDP